MKRLYYMFRNKLLLLLLLIKRSTVSYWLCEITLVSYTTQIRFEYNFWIFCFTQLSKFGENIWEKIKREAVCWFLLCKNCSKKISWPHHTGWTRFIRSHSSVRFSFETKEFELTVYFKCNMIRMWQTKLAKNSN